MVEKRLENSTKEADDKIDKMQQKLDEADITMKKKEKLVGFLLYLHVYWNLSLLFSFLDWC